jgi:uncharacterized membrane protein
MINNPFHILVVFLGLISLTLTLVSKSRIAKKLSPVIIILFFSAVLANLGIIPTKSPFYENLSAYAVPFAVCLILMHVRLADIKKTALPILKAFAVASIGSMLGCLAAGILLTAQLNAMLPGEGWKLTGPYIGTYIGGSLNFVSMWTGLKIESPELFAAANAVDNLTLLPIFMFWVLSPQLLEKWFVKSNFDTLNNQIQTQETPVILKINDLLKLSFTALLIMVLSGLIKKHLIAGWMPQIPTILIVTTLALAVAQFKSIKKLQGSKQLGNFAFYLFFAAIGAMMDIPMAVKLAPVLFIYVTIIIVTQIVFVLLIGKILKIDFRLLAVASIAAKAGPSTVVAYTNVKNYNYLALPGVAAGLLGYAIGNYFAFVGAYLLKFILA